MELLVLREGVHRMPAEAYADELRQRLDGHTVRHATTPAEERRLVPAADVITGPQIRQELLDRADDLKLFACTFAGTGHLPMDSLADADVAVTSAAGVHTPNASEHAIGSLLMFSRRLHDAARADSWQQVMPGELAGSTVTIVGLGAIGTGIAERLEPFGVTTLGIRRQSSKGGPTDEVFSPENLHEALARTDFLVLCCPLTSETQGLIGESELSTLPPEAVLVNIARGAVVDTDALVGALRRGRLGGAALDVTDPEPLPDDHPLWNFDNVVVTPHTAGATPEYYSRLADILIDNVGRLTEGRSLRNQVRYD